MNVSDKPVVLVVDDTPANIHILNELLHDQYFVRVGTSGPAALSMVRTEPRPDILLLDIMMPGMNGYDVCQQLKADPETADIPVVFITAMNEESDEAKGLDLGAVDYITKPFSPRLVQARVQNHISLKKHRDELSELVRERTHELYLTRTATIESLASLAETRDPETGGHIRRTQKYVRILAEHARLMYPSEWQLDDRTVDLLYSSAPLHDVGKVGIPDTILLKTGKLTPEEFSIMEKHAVYGYEALKCAEKQLGESSFLGLGAEIAYTHHEKWDGSGYPRKLTGRDIPQAGRLMALADVYDALISKRVYKPPFPHSKAVEIILQGKGKHFDPQLVEAFEARKDVFREVALEFADFDEERSALSA